MGKTVLVIGANGFVGQEAAIEFARQGHTVVGVVRKAAAAEPFAKYGIRAVIGDTFADPSFLAEELAQADIIFDAVGVGELATFQPLYDAVIKAAKATIRPTKRFIYTSGCLVFGNRDEIIDDDEGGEMGMKGRAEIEALMLTKSDLLVTSVVRPAWIYGGNFGKYSPPWFKTTDGKVVIDGSPDKRFNWVHVVDLAQAIVTVATAPAQSIWGKAVNVADDKQVYSYREFRIAFAKVAGWKGTDADVVEVPEPAWAGMEITAVLSSGRALSLGWKARQKPLIEGFEEHYRTYLALTSS
eukprot:TRINITY_DN5605_c1_g1_i1.p1 TRINITY_DN5605_c1_g1~~TRINITY_DN5605_c1_g1_i1.p1  ORF type:complete len:348 (+),score=93.18 TRINITY_DN5605_c1_g1_i1:153-1046(+)